MSAPLVLPDGTRLSRRSWPAIGPSSKAILMVVHGLGEHSGRYEVLGERLSQLGITVEAVDLRGHGHSSGKRGHLGSLEVALDDLMRWMRSVPGDESIPRFLLGHSLGGLLVTKLIVAQSDLDLAGLLLSSPALALSHPPPKWQVFWGRLASHLLPCLTMGIGLNPNCISSDPAEVEAYLSDPLIHNQISLATARWLVEGMGTHAASLPLPCLVVHGDADEITSHGASQEFAESTGAQFKSFPGAFHELLHEPTHLDALLAEYAQFILKQSLMNAQTE